MQGHLVKEAPSHLYETGSPRLSHPKSLLPSCQFIVFFAFITDSWHSTLSLHTRKEAPCGQGLYLLFSPWHPELPASGSYIAFGETEWKKGREKERREGRKGEKRGGGGRREGGRDGFSLHIYHQGPGEGPRTNLNWSFYLEKQLLSGSSEIIKHSLKMSI